MSLGYGVGRRLGNHVSAIFLSIALTCAASASAAQTVRIAALGDSLTQGYGLMDHEGFTAQLQDWLDANSVAAAIVNAGVSGDTTAGGLSRVEWTLSDDIDAMIVALGGNDVLRGIDPAVARANLRGIMEVGADKGVPMMIVGITAPGNYGADYKAEFEAIYSDLAADFDAIYVPSFLGPLEELGDMSDVIATYMQPDGIHPNAKGVGVIVEALGPTVAELADAVDPAS